MLLHYFYDDSLAQASYMVACQACGEALIIDPARDITPYLQTAKAHNLRIAHVTETHIHADFVSGSRELAAKTGARLYLSGMGGADWQYDFTQGDTVVLKDGDAWMVGNVRVEVLHTPGHTPEHLAFQITDTAGANRPMGIFTGDFLFVSDVGRPDLLKGFGGSKEDGARGQFANVQRFKSMADYLQIWPGHGAGSACGKALGAVPSTTLGYEKLFNPAFQIDSEEAFVEWLVSEQPEVPRYFPQMKRVNKRGPALLADLAKPQPLPADELASVLQTGVLVIDTRSREAFAQKFMPGTLHIVRGNNAYAGWFVDYAAPTYLIAEMAQIDEVVGALRAIGVDDIPGYFTPDAIAGATTSLRSVSAPELAEKVGEVYLLDVRAEAEYQASHIPRSQHIHYGQLSDHLDTIPRQHEIVIYCATGVRSQIAASLLRKHGFERIAHLKGGIEAWQAGHFPLEQPDLLQIP